MNYIDDTGWDSYNGLQAQLRHRFSHGLTWTINYTWSKSLTNLPADNANQSIDFTSLRNTDLDKRPSQFDIRHVIQAYGTYDLPVGRGRWLSPSNSIVNGIVGDWRLGSVFVFSTGQPLQLTGGFQTVNSTNNTAAQGVVLAPGVMLSQIQSMFDAELTRLTGRPAGTTTDIQRLAVDPQLIGPDFRANPQFLIPNRTPGSFGQQLFIRDKNTFQWDLSIGKSFPLPIPHLEEARLQIFAALNNVLNHPRWAFGDTTGNPPGSLNVFSTSFGVINGPTGNRSVNLRAVFSF
jgi:hypothetical protein